MCQLGLHVSISCQDIKTEEIKLNAEKFVIKESHNILYSIEA